MLLDSESLSHKTVLEVGSGRGDTTRKLVDLLSGQSGARLIVTDISDAFFHGLQDEFRSRDVRVEFICTEAQALSGIPDNSIDYLVCNYTLCAVNSRAGSAALQAGFEKRREAVRGRRIPAERGKHTRSRDLGGEVAYFEISADPCR